MLWVAFTLGLFGSLHCLGMCGPIAIGFQRFQPEGKAKLFVNAFAYNLGRILTYGILGLTLGLIGQALWVSGLQKAVSIVAGILFIILFLLSMDLEQFFFRFSFFKNLFQKYNQFVTKSFSAKMYHNGFFLGIINGLIPCGLVYLALAGAFLEKTMVSSVIFMLVFGLGTLPMMGFISLGGGLLSVKAKAKFKKITPYLQLAMGVWFLYRGILIDYPMDIDFYLGLKEGPMCH